MSSVRMCDNCRSIFSENDPGWQRGTVRNLAVINGETVVQEQSEDRCPNCAVGAVAQGNAVRIYQPELPRTQRGMDPRVQSALAGIAHQDPEVRDAVGQLAAAAGVDLGAPSPPPTPVLPEGVQPMGVPPRLLPGNMEAVDVDAAADHEQLLGERGAAPEDYDP